MRNHRPRQAGDAPQGRVADGQGKHQVRPQGSILDEHLVLSICSLFGDCKGILDSKDDPEKLQNFVNSWLAEPWEDTKLKTNADLVMERQTEYEELVVPEWAKLLTAGVDVQENCLYWSIRAWGNYLTSQNIAHGQAFSFHKSRES